MPPAPDASSPSRHGLPQGRYRTSYSGSGDLTTSAGGTQNIQQTNNYHGSVSFGGGAEPINWKQKCLQSLSFKDMDSRAGDIKLAARGTCKWFLRHDKYKAWASGNGGLLWIKGLPGSGKSTLLRHALGSIQGELGPDSDADPDPDSDVDSNSDVNPDSDVNSDSYMGSDSDADSDLDVDRYSDLDSDSEPGPGPDLDAGPDLEPRTDLVPAPIDPNSDPAGHGAVVLSFYYHARGSSLQKSPEGLYRSLLHQLGSIDDALSDVVARFEKNCLTIGEPAAKWDWRLPELQRMLKSALRKTLRYHPVWLFVDALDESGRQNAIDLIYNFRSLMHDFGRDGFRTFHICFTCRHYPNLPVDQRELQIRVEEENHQDIRTFVSGRLGSSISRDILHMVTKRASGVFLWAWLVVEKLVDQESRGATLRQMEATIDGVPEDLDALYLQLIQRMDDQSLKLLQWVCFAFRPLELGEWRWAALLDVEANCPYRSIQECMEAEGFCRDTQQLENQVRELSCGLVEVTGGSMIQFIHQTTREFFLDKGLATLSQNLSRTASTNSCASHGSQVETEAHYRLSRSCMRYIAMKGNTTPPSPSPHSRYPQRTLLYYSVTNWGSHASKAEDKGTDDQGNDIMGYLSRDFTQAYLYWLNITDRNMDRPGKHAGLLHIACHAGLMVPLKKMLWDEDKYAVGVFVQDDHGRTPLFYAARHGNTAAIQLLLEPKTAGLGIIRRVRQSRIDIADRDGSTALSWAASRGHTDIVRFLVERGAQVNSVDYNGRSPLSLAAVLDRADTVRFLVERGAQVNSVDYTGRSPLSWATALASTDMLRFLVERGAWIDSFDYQGRTPLSHAAGQDWTADRTRCLVELGAQVNSVDHQGRTPLLWAAVNGNSQAVRLLLEQDARVDSLDCRGRSPLSWASMSSRVSLKSSGVVVMSYGMKKRRIVVKRLLNWGAKVDLRDHDGRTAMSHAAEGGLASVIELLLREGAMPDTPDGLGRTPLSWAASMGCIGAVTTLLNHGAQIDYADAFDRTPLDWATEGGWGPADDGDTSVGNVADGRTADSEDEGTTVSEGGVLASLEAKSAREAVARLLRESAGSRVASG